jgi:aromatic-L-amino-acid decarboxylase
LESAEFRKHAHAFVDWMADYLDEVERYPVRAQVAPGEIAAKLPVAPPEQPEPMADIFRDFEDIVLPGLTHWQHPSFFAYFPANSSRASVLAEMLTATLGIQGMVWQTSPAATELETRVMDWLRQMIGLPEGFAGTIQDTASTASLCAILSARERATGFRGNQAGLGAAPGLTMYCSEETNSSIEKDVKIAGIGVDNLRKIVVDEVFAMRPEALERAIEADMAAGLHPACVIACLGTTGTGAIDPLRPIGEICRKHDIWLHVDAAWAGSALVLPEQRWMIDGIEHVDSFVFNPHKWLFTNFDCSAYFVRDPEALIRTFAIDPEYLKTAQDRHAINFRDWSIQLGRRFRALKLWFVIRDFGVEGLRQRISAHIDMARDVAEEIERTEDFELVAPRSLALFCFRYHPPGLDDPAALDDLNARLLERLNDSGALYLSHTLVDGAYALRFSIGQTGTGPEHVARAWERIQDTARGSNTKAGRSPQHA